MYPTHILWGEDNYQLIGPDLTGYNMENPDIVPIPAGYENFPTQYLTANYETRTFTINVVQMALDKWEEVKIKRDQVSYGGMPTPLGRVHTDRESYSAASAAVVSALVIGSSFSMIWTMEDNTDELLDTAKARTLLVLMYEHYQAARAAAAALRTQLETAVTQGDHAAIINLDIEGAAWPE